MAPGAAVDQEAHDGQGAEAWAPGPDGCILEGEGGSQELQLTEAPEKL